MAVFVWIELNLARLACVQRNFVLLPLYVSTVVVVSSGLGYSVSYRDKAIDLVLGIVPVALVFLQESQGPKILHAVEEDHSVEVVYFVLEA